MVTATRDLATELRRGMRGRVLTHEAMARHTSFQIGGPADLLVVPEDLDDLKAALAFARFEHLPVLVLGSGSNTLVRDGGIRGMVILPSALQELARQGMGTALRPARAVHEGILP